VLIPANARAAPSQNRGVANHVSLPAKEPPVHLALTILAAIVPALLLLWYFYARDVHREPRRIVLTTFLLGLVATVPVIMVELRLNNWYVATHSTLTESGSFIRNPLLYALFKAFIVAALVEEFFKFLVLRFYSARRAAFDEPMDGIVYGATASLGFALFENVLYVVGGGWQVALMRAFTAVPLHAALGAILGYYVGQSKFGRVKRGMVLRGLFYAWLLHGLYDFALFALTGLAKSGSSLGEVLATPLAGLALGVLLFGVIRTIVLVRRLRTQQLAALHPSIA
jgi:RsiW-degrading membrane proteinase PrsW (M82 family)